MLQVYQKPLNGKRVGIVFGSFAPLHTGHLDIIMKAKKECDGGCIVVVCGYDGDKGEPLIPHAKRYRYIREFFDNDDLVAVYAINDTEQGLEKYPNGWTGWLKEFNRIWKDEAHINDSAKRVWYVGDKVYYDDLCKMNEEVYLTDRIATNPICATNIRNNPIENWNKITQPFKRVYSHNILICGTASEGKTTLTQDLGKYFNAPYSWEWARDYMEEHSVIDWELDISDYMTFLTGQYEFNRKMIDAPNNKGVFFADSDSMVTRMYAEYYAKDSSCTLTEKEFNIIAKMADAYTAKSRWNKIFLLPPHGIFVDDHSRFMAHSGMKEREELFEILCKNIKNSGNWGKVTILKGSYYENFIAIVNYVKNEVFNNA